MDEKADRQTKPVTDKRVYSTPVLQRLGTLKDLTRSVGQRGSKDGGRNGNQKKTSW